jgi:hypothetical protein
MIFLMASRTSGTSIAPVPPIVPRDQAFAGWQCFAVAVSFRCSGFENVRDERHVVVIGNRDRVQIVAATIGDERQGICRTLFSRYSVLALPVLVPRRVDLKITTKEMRPFVH